jgi:hypothetical protein
MHSNSGGGSDPVSVLGWDVEPPRHRPLDPDDVVEFHAARILLLLHVCGAGATKRVEGRTKLVKLDFFLRYPRFLERAQSILASRGLFATDYRSPRAETEAPMIRYRYGPWDPRYRDVVAFLEARKLVRIAGTRTEVISLTAGGRSAAAALATHDQFSTLRGRAEVIAVTMASWTGSQLKDFIYEVFPREVGDLAMRRGIAP